ncbi:MAG: hypothetical protein AB7S26_08780 [Sandaracinaceae bacterium]
MSTKMRWVMAFAIAGVIGGCDSRGGDDAGPIVIMRDGGGGGTDAGPGGGTDAGPPAGSCAVSSVMPLPAACLPRCSNATLQAANACTDAACQQAALDADTTASIQLTTPGMPVALDCATCVAWQQETCAAEVCPTEYMALITCLQMNGGMAAMCMAENTALNTCANMTQMAAFQACANPRASMCFSAT